MFQKSLQILIVSVLLALAAVVAYSLLRFRGPEDQLREAEERIRAGSPQSAIHLLDQAETKNVIAHPSVRDRLWRLRAEANTLLGNPRGALRDVESLLSNGHGDDIELQLDRIRLLAQSGDGVGARAAARRFVEAHPNHTRGLELAGEACQTAYQPRLRALRERIDAELGRRFQDEARIELLSYLYRPEGDARVPLSQRQLAALFQSEPRLVAAWPPIREEAAQVRGSIQEGLGYFERSLDLGGQPVAAFRAIATALRQSGRIDDLLFACEIQRRKYDHAYVLESGVFAVWARLQENMPRAAVAGVARWLTPDEVAARAAAGTLTAAAEQLATANALAAWKAGDRTAVGEASRLIHQLRQVDFRDAVTLNVSLATRHLATGSEDLEQIESSASTVVRRAAAEPKPIASPDLVAEFAPIWIDCLLERGATENEVLEALRVWRTARPEDPRPRLQSARYQLARSQTEAAFAALDDAAKVAPDHPELFPLRLDVARRHYENGAQSGPELLAQCVRDRTPVPDIIDPIGYVLCAEEALRQPGAAMARIATSCARSAVDAFPKSNVPRQLELRALLRAELAEEAARAADLALAAIVPDAATLALVIEAKRAAGQPIRGVLRLAVPLVPRNAHMQTELLRVALADTPMLARRFVGAELTDATAPRATRALAARALAIAGDVDAARQVLLGLGSAAADDAEADQIARAFSTWLDAAALDAADEPLRERACAVRDALPQLDGRQEAVLDVVEAIATSHPATAHALIEVALRRAAPAERSGRRYALAGELAARAGDLVAAETHWLAALGFADGARAAEPLTRLLVLQGREERAAQVYRLVTKPTDPALAARMGRLVEAANMVAADLQAEPADLLTHATLATFGQPAMVDWKLPTDPDVQRARLELVAGLRDPNLASLTTPRAAALLKAPTSRVTHGLLAARAAADRGDGAAATRLHGALNARGLANPVFWREVAYAAKTDGYRVPPDLAKKLMTAATTNGLAGSELSAAYCARLIVDGFVAGGFPDMARQTRLLQWLGAPQLQDWSADDVELVATGHAPEVACRILDAMLRGPHTEDHERDALLRRYYELAASAPAPARAELLATAQRHLQSDGARGDVVHFLLSRPDDEDRRRRAELLTAHLRRVGRGDEGTELLERSVAMLVDAVGLAEATARVDALVAELPTALPLWGTRARLRTRLTGERAALDELRVVLTHAQAPHAELAFLGLAAADRRLLPQDLELLARLPAALRDSATGKYVRGLIALRLGDHDEAIRCLTEGARQPDGRHLFALALAHLESPADDGPERARALLVELLRDYPSSSLARHAGSFVRQLSPRAATDDDSDEKR